jgi:hypothetical protein
VTALHASGNATASKHGLTEAEHVEIFRSGIPPSIPGAVARLLRETGTPEGGWAAVVSGSVPIAFGTRPCERGFNVT